MNIDSRYLATVRRAIEIPSALNNLAILSSDSAVVLFSVLFSYLILCRTDSADEAVPS